jgi:ATP-dependent RNA helicase SUPV3L1/SUV3
VAILQAGAHPMAPEFRLLCSDLLDAARRDLLRTRLQLWMKAHLVATTPALPKLLAAELTGAARGVAYQLVEGMGCVSSDAVASLVRNLDEAGRKALGRMGVRFGTESVYLPGLLKPKAVLTRAVLWSVYHQSFPESGAPPAGRVTIPRDAGTPDGFYRAVGYVRLGEWVLRVDIAERLAALARAASRKGVFVVNDEMLSLAAATKEAMAGILGDLGYRRAGESEGVTQFLRRRSRPTAPKSVNKSKNKKAEQAGANPATGPKKPRNKKRPALQGNAARDEVRMLADSPFAVLKRLRVGK